MLYSFAVSGPPSVTSIQQFIEKTHGRSSVTLTEQIVDLTVGMIVHIDPVHFGNVFIAKEGAVVILMRVFLGLGYVILGEGVVREVREFGNSYVSEFTIGRIG